MSEGYSIITNSLALCISSTLSVIAYNYVLYDLEFMIFSYNIHNIHLQIKGSDFLDGNYSTLGTENT